MFLDHFHRIAATTIVLGALNCTAAHYAGWAVGHTASGEGAIVATKDSGTTWVRQGTDQVVGSVLYGICAVDPTSAWVVGASEGGYATIYHTTDQGATWDRMGFGDAALAGITLFKVHVSSNTVFAVGPNAILRSRDGGATWTNCFPAEYAFTHLQAVFSLDGTTVWVGGSPSNGSTTATMLFSTTAGDSWVQQVMTQANNILGICAVNAQTAWAVGGSGFLLFRTDDSGTTWREQHGVGGLGDANEVSAVNTQVVYVAVDNLVEWTTNGGEQWLSFNAVNYVMGISAVNEQEAWAVSTGGMNHTGSIFHTTNGGTTWETYSGEGLPELWNVSFARTPIPEPAAGLLICCGLLVMRKKRTGDRSSVSFLNTR